MINLGGQRWISVLALLAVLSGCASSHVSILPGGRDIPEGEAGGLHVLAVGDEAIVVMLDGSEVRGSVVEISSSSIVLGHTSNNFRYDDTRIKTQSIDSIVCVKGGGNWPFYVVGVVVVVIGIAALVREELSNYD